MQLEILSLYRQTLIRMLEQKYVCIKLMFCILHYKFEILYSLSTIPPENMKKWIVCLKIVFSEFTNNTNHVEAKHVCHTKKINLVSLSVAY